MSEVDREPDRPRSCLRLSGVTFTSADIGKRITVLTSSSPLYRTMRIVQLVEPRFDPRIGLCSNQIEVA